MTGNYSSKIDPDFKFSPSTTIAVTPVEGPQKLETKFYIDKIVNELKKRGFKNVYSARKAEELSLPIDVILVVELRKDVKSYQYDSPVYGLVNSGNSTVNCSGFGYSVNCTQNNQKTLGVVGHSTKTDTLTVYFFGGRWYNTATNDVVMKYSGISFEENCSDSAVYNFIIHQTLKRLDFEKPENYKYSIKMPKEYSCST